MLVLGIFTLTFPDPLSALLHSTLGLERLSRPQSPLASPWALSMRFPLAGGTRGKRHSPSFQPAHLHPACMKGPIAEAPGPFLAFFELRVINHHPVTTLGYCTNPCGLLTPCPHLSVSSKLSLNFPTLKPN